MDVCLGCYNLNVKGLPKIPNSDRNLNPYRCHGNGVKTFDKLGVSVHH